MDCCIQLLQIAAFNCGVPTYRHSSGGMVTVPHALAAESGRVPRTIDGAGRAGSRVCAALYQERGLHAVPWRGALAANTGRAIRAATAQRLVLKKE